MPTYAYACTSCDNRFEVHQSFSDDSLTRCERCEGTLRKLFNSVGIVFKGSGFYRTDSRAASAAAPGGSGKGSGKDSGGKDSGGKEAARTSASEGSSGKGPGSFSGTKESTPSGSRSTHAAAAKT